MRHVCSNACTRAAYQAMKGITVLLDPMSEHPSLTATRIKPTLQNYTVCWISRF